MTASVINFAPAQAVAPYIEPGSRAERRALSSLGLQPPAAAGRRRCPSMLALLCAGVFLGLLIVGAAAMLLGLWACVQFATWAVSLWGPQ